MNRALAVMGLDSWVLSMLDAEQGARIVWGLALRRLPGAGLCCAIGIMHGYLAANENAIQSTAAPHGMEIEPAWSTAIGARADLTV